MFSFIATLIEALLKGASFFSKSRDEKLGATDQKLADAKETITLERDKQNADTINSNLSNDDLADKLR
jgi:hypothetical protein